MVTRTTAISLGVGTTGRRSLARMSVISLGSFFTASPYVSGGGLAPTTNRRNLRSFLPDRSVPFTEANGTPNQQWWNCFKYVIDEVLAIQDGISLRDVKAASDYSALQSIITAAASAATDQQVRQNAATLQAVTQVAVAAALPGATQIPPVQLVRRAYQEFEL